MICLATSITIGFICHSASSRLKMMVDKIARMNALKILEFSLLLSATLGESLLDVTSIKQQNFHILESSQPRALYQWKQLHLLNQLILTLHCNNIHRC